VSEQHLACRNFVLIFYLFLGLFFVLFWRPQGKRLWKSTVVVTTPELCIRKEVVTLLGRKMEWDVVVVDEAHRLKSSKSKLNVSRPAAAEASDAHDRAAVFVGGAAAACFMPSWSVLCVARDVCDLLSACVSG